MEHSISQLQQKLANEQQKSVVLEIRLSTAEQKSVALEERCQSLEAQCESLETSLLAEKQKSKSLEERLKGIENTVEQFWIIPRDEITLSENILRAGEYSYVKEATFRDQKIAAKCLDEATISPHNKELFKKEMKISARCHHKNLVEFIGAVPDYPPIIVFEMMDCTVRFALSEGRIAHNHIYPICIDVAQGLLYLHSIQPYPLIHRNMSASNVLLKAKGTGWTAKLSDLGSAQFANVAQVIAPGCTQCAIPKRDKAYKQAEKIDVYSYGVLLIEILSNELPTGVLFELINSLQPTRPQFVPLIQQCTNINPTKRPTMKEVVSSLHTITYEALP